MRYVVWLVLFCFFGLVSTAYCVSLTIEQRIEKIIKSVPGQIGVAALHLESGKRVNVNGDIKFPMASTYKVPIALCCLSMVDDGKFNLKDKKMFLADDLRRFSNISSGQQLSIQKIIQLMIEKSDNTASDMILRMVGGGGGVTSWLRTHGINDMRIDRSTLKMCADISGIRLNDDYHCTIQKCTKLMSEVSNNDKIVAQKKFFDDQRDTTTPCAMVDLLAGMYRKKFVSASSTNFLLNCMKNCYVFGKGRIPRLLPRKCKIWHKTGRIDRMDSDVGIIQLPHGKGHVVLALYSNKDTRHEAKREFAIAKVTRALYDYFSV